MKRVNVFLFMAVLAALLLVAGCTAVQPQGAAAPAGASDSAAAPADTGLLGKIKEKGTIVFGTSADYPPYESIDADGKFVGLRHGPGARHRRKAGRRGRNPGYAV